MVSIKSPAERAKLNFIKIKLTCLFPHMAIISFCCLNKHHQFFLKSLCILFLCMFHGTFSNHRSQMNCIHRPVSQQQTFCRVIARKAQVELITQRMSMFQQSLQWNAAINNVIRYTCVWQDRMYAAKKKGRFDFLLRSWLCSLPHCVDCVRSYCIAVTCKRMWV